MKKLSILLLMMIVVFACGEEEEIQISNTIEEPPSLAWSCDGSLNGNIFYTVNFIPRNVTQYAVMNASGWSWTKTSGTAFYSTSGSGKNFNVEVPYGTANFQATRPGCPTRNFTFVSY